MKSTKSILLVEQLIEAVARRDRMTIRRLLEAGADPNQPGPTGLSAIACAGENDETGDIVRMLVNAGANVNIQDEFGQTPLHFAVDVAIDGATQQNRESINWDAVGVLLQLGADRYIADNNGRTIVDLVSKYGCNARQSFDNWIEGSQAK